MSSTLQIYNNNVSVLFSFHKRDSVDLRKEGDLLRCEKLNLFVQPPDYRASSRSRYSRSPSPRRRSISRGRSRSPYSRSPVRRSRTRSASPEHLHSILVTNLTRNVNEEHVREIFSQFGKISALDFPINKVCK